MKLRKKKLLTEKPQAFYLNYRRVKTQSGLTQWFCKNDTILIKFTKATDIRVTIFGN